MGRETPCSSPSMPSPCAITSPGLFSILHIVYLGLLQYCSIAWEFGALSWMSTVKWIAANCPLLTVIHCNNDWWLLFQELTWHLWGLRLFSAQLCITAHKLSIERSWDNWRLLESNCRNLHNLEHNMHSFPSTLPTTSFDTRLQESNFIGATSVWQERKILFTAQKLHLIMLLDYPLRNFQFLADIVLLQNWW